MTARQREYYWSTRDQRLKAQAEYSLRNREAVRDSSRRFREKNRERLADYQRMRNYGLDGETYREMISRQCGQCAICGIAPKGKGKHGLHVDHDHKTGEVRDLLCGNCNLALGKAEDNPFVFDRMAAYLRSHDHDPETMVFEEDSHLW